MNIIECFKSSLKNVFANKLRSFLTMLGIIIGISSVITIYSIGEGGRNYISNEFEGIGSNSLNISVKGKAGEDLEKYYFNKEDSNILMEKIPEIKSSCPILNGYCAAVNEGKSKETTLFATSPEYKDIINAKLLDGRFLSDNDINGSRNVIVIDNIIADKLFKGENPIGKKLTLKGSLKFFSFTIIGVVKNPNPSLTYEFSDNFPGFTFIPYTSADKIFNNPSIKMITVTLNDKGLFSDVSQKIIRILESKYKVKDRYLVEESFKQIEILNTVLSTFTVIIGIIGGISLLVGGIGVMNIMLVSVTERTREIGIRKALGAKKKDILLQFLAESLIICLIGGIIGSILGISFSALICYIIGIKPYVSSFIIILSFLFSSSIGVFFGIYPAKKASNLNPIDALRYE